MVLKSRFKGQKNMAIARYLGNIQEGRCAKKSCNLYAYISPASCGNDSKFKQQNIFWLHSAQLI